MFDEFNHTGENRFSLMYVKRDCIEMLEETLVNTRKVDLHNISIGELGRVVKETRLLLRELVFIESRMIQFLN